LNKKAKRHTKKTAAFRISSAAVVSTKEMDPPDKLRKGRIDVQSCWSSTETCSVPEETVVATGGTAFWEVLGIGRALGAILNRELYV